MNDLQAGYRAALRALEAPTAIPAPAPEDSPAASGRQERTGKGVGARLPRKEDMRFLLGRGRYVGDIGMPGLMEVAFVRSPLAHARIRRIDIPAEFAGRAFTAADLIGSCEPIRVASTPETKIAGHPILASGKVRMVGEPIVACMARTRAEAEDMCERIVLDLEELPAVVDALEARRPGAPLVHEELGDNVFLATETDVHFEEFANRAEVVVRREYRLARNCQVPMEGKGALAYWDDQAEQLVEYSSTQAPHTIRTAISIALGLEEGRIRVIAPDVGGGFGFKSVLQQEEIFIAWLGLKLRHPVRWIEDRREHLIAAANARQHHYVVTAYADRRGKLLALDTEFSAPVGAYSCWPTSAQLEALHVRRHMPGNYAVSGYRMKTYTVATNQPPMVPYRGVAKPGMAVAMELTLDAVARAVGRDPAQVKLDNLIPADAMPATTATGQLYDSGDYPRCLATALDEIRLTEIRSRQQRGEADGRLIGVGAAMYTEVTAMGTRAFAGLGWPIRAGLEQATLRVTPDGGLEVRVGLGSPGVGLATTLAQVAHEFLGIDTERIKVVLGDSALTPYSTGTFNSRGAVVGGGAVARAARIIARRLSHIGAHLLRCDADQVSLRDGSVVSADGRRVAIADVASTYYLKPDELPPDVDSGGLEVTEGFKPGMDSGAVGYGAHAAVVAIDPELGRVEILDYVIVEDCGTILNPMIVEGQAYGGTAQGIGQALYEEMPYDEAGQPLASTLADYLLPGACEVPRIKIVHTETPSPHTELGIKGVGEGATIGAVGAVMSAVNDALALVGAELNETPASPRRIIAALQKAGRDAAQRSASA